MKAVALPLDRQVRLDGGDQVSVIRLHLRAEASHDDADWRHEKLLKIPLHIARLAVSIWRRDQLLVNRVAAVTVHFDLFVHRERDAVGRRTKGQDFFGRTWFLAEELVTGKPNHAESTVGIFLLQFFESCVLRRETTLGRHIDEKKGFSFMIGK